ncbi:MAG: glutamate racemase [Oscillospiraceae bacterium]|jgi:glutamate racemase|nr:glutamate racemase [Oscillospiraceae bacterium]
MKNKPIGVFDSGLGGLTVVRELIRALPGEDIVYFGDTGRVPYGGRSFETIERYAREDANFLLRQNVKYIIAACGTVSSVAPHTGALLPVPYKGVVAPAAKAAALATKNGKIGVIGTQATISSGAYSRELSQIDGSFQVFEVACPLFVPLVESGWIEPSDPVLKLTVRRYIASLLDKTIDTLILGCTHYPILSGAIGAFCGESVKLISSGHASATEATRELCELGLLRDERTGGKVRFYVSDITASFSDVTNILFGGDLAAQRTLVSIDD